MSIRRLACTVLVLAASGCHSMLTPPDGGKHGMTPEDMSVAGGGGDLAGADMLQPATGDMTCIAPITSCAGLCGPIADPCTGTSLLCGGCPASQVCNLATHVCEVPKSTCSDLMATCGNTRNSCGTRLFCGDCTAGKMCNGDTNQCVTCAIDTSTPAATIASCQKLGYECGQAWLGCGPRNNLSDCGPCPTGLQCNLIFNRCEATCTPPDKTTACANAKANNGIDCGVIDDGCGGAIDCGGCSAGFGCGAQGDPGICEPLEQPVECATTGRNCGTITSLCGGTVNCGTCTGTNVCNSNGICGPPCTPLTCATATNPPACGTIPDGCGGTVGPCMPCGSGYTCVNNQCCKLKTCAGDYAGMCGTGLDDGCGGHSLNCNCSSGACTTKTAGMTGTCCVNTAKCAANTCNTSYTDTCTGIVHPCTCTSTQWCDTSTSPGTCRALETCAQIIGEAPGKQGDKCSNGNAFDAGGGHLIECQCGPGGLCLPVMAPPPTSSPPVTGTTQGWCCFNTNTCAGHCNGTTTNTCTGATINCTCNGFCDVNNTCQPFKTCGSYGANGGVNNPCSNGPSFDNGNGTLLTCPCGGSLECSSGGTIVSGGTQGKCCAPPTCNGQCNVTLTDPCGGPSVVCPSSCGAGFFCASNNICTPLKTCANYQTKNPLGSPGDVCGSFSDGNGGTISCPCDTSAPFSSQNMCVTGTCQCTNTKTCTKCTDNGTLDQCGKPLSCACPNGDPNHNICDPNGTAANVDGFGCCYPYSASHLPAGWPAAGPMGEPVCTPAISDGCGGSFSIPCPANNPNGNSPTNKSWPNVKCVIQAGGYGLCECTPDACPNTDTSDDGCGNVPMCHA